MKIESDIKLKGTIQLYNWDLLLISSKEDTLKLGFIIN